MRKVSIVVPVYKKEGIIRESTSRQLQILHSAAERFGLDYELIAVVDGKHDRSAYILGTIYHPKLRVISYHQNQGKGYALRVGMSIAEGDYIGFIDAGLDIEPKVIDQLLEKLLTSPETHIVTANKKHPESFVRRKPWRNLMTYSYSWLTWTLLGIDYQDTQVGAKLFSRQLINTVLPRMTVRRFAFDVELLAVAHSLGYQEHLDVPVVIDGGLDRSSAAQVKEIVRIINDTVRVAYRLHVQNYYHPQNRQKWQEVLPEVRNHQLNQLSQDI